MKKKVKKNSIKISKKNLLSIWIFILIGIIVLVGIILILLNYNKENGKVLMSPIKAPDLSEFDCPGCSTRTYHHIVMGPPLQCNFLGRYYQYSWVALDETYTIVKVPSYVLTKYYLSKYESYRSNVGCPSGLPVLFYYDHEVDNYIPPKYALFQGDIKIGKILSSDAYHTEFSYDYNIKKDNIRSDIVLIYYVAALKYDSFITTHTVYTDAIRNDDNLPHTKETKKIIIIDSQNSCDIKTEGTGDDATGAYIKTVPRINSITITLTNKDNGVLTEYDPFDPPSTINGICQVSPTILTKNGECPISFVSPPDTSQCYYSTISRDLEITQDVVLSRFRTISYIEKFENPSMIRFPSNGIIGVGEFDTIDSTPSVSIGP